MDLEKGKENTPPPPYQGVANLPRPLAANPVNQNTPIPGVFGLLPNPLTANPALSAIPALVANPVRGNMNNSVFDTSALRRHGNRRIDNDYDINRGPPNAVLTSGVRQESSDIDPDEAMMGMGPAPSGWDLVENDTPPYIRAQQAEARRAAQIQMQEATLAARDAALAQEAAMAAQGMPSGDFTRGGRGPPGSTMGSAGNNRVRVYEQTTTRRISFAPGTLPPRFMPQGTPMPHMRRPTPFPLGSTPSHGQASYHGTPNLPARVATPHPGAGGSSFRLEDNHRLDTRDSQDTRHQQLANQTYRGRQPQSMLRGGELQFEGFHQPPRRPMNLPQPHGMTSDEPGRSHPASGMRNNTGPPLRHTDGRSRPPPRNQRPADFRDHEVRLDQYGNILRERHTPDMLAATTRRNRPHDPTRRQEDSSDDRRLNFMEPRPTRPFRPIPYYQDDDEGDDEASSMDQNRPEDYRQQPRGRGVLRVTNPDPEYAAAVREQQERPRPAICRDPVVERAVPLYGRLNVEQGRQWTPEFDRWLHESAQAAGTRDDPFHEFERAREEHSAQRGQRTLTRRPAFSSLPGARPGGPTGSNDATAGSSAQTGANNDGKREADSLEEERPSKRTRLANSFRRKLSLSAGTTLGDSQLSGDTIPPAKRRVSGLDIFNVRSFSSMRSGLSRASSIGPKRVRIAVVGDCGAGKTSLLNRLYTGKYEPGEKSLHHRSTDFSMTIDGQAVTLEAWDIPGDLPVDETHPLNRSFFDAVLICFAVDDIKNLDRAPHWMGVLRSCLVVDIPLYLVGCKDDERSSFPKLSLTFMQDPPQSTRDQCETVARAIGAVEYFECSAALNKGVTDLFNTVVRHARSKKDEEELKRASRLRKEKLKRGFQDTGRRFTNLFRKGKNA